MLRFPVRVMHMRLRPDLVEPSSCKSSFPVLYSPGAAPPLLPGHHRKSDGGFRNEAEEASAVVNLLAIMQHGRSVSAVVIFDLAPHYCILDIPF